MRTITLLLLLFYYLPNNAQMYTLDPQRQWWGHEAASIENVVFEVRSAGIYYEVALAFDLFGESPSNWSENPLEFVFDFTMDDDIVFNDSWLWIEDYISRGEIYEKWEGTEIYEGIVNRQQDPSILTKYSDGNYNLKVYPLDPDSTRRVRLSYLAPMKGTREDISGILPLQLLSYSRITPANVELIIEHHEDWKIKVDEDIWMQIDNQGNEETFVLTTNTINLNSKLIFEPAIQRNYYHVQKSINGENYFQLMYFPNIDIPKEQKNIMILLDFDERNTFLEEEELLALLESKLRTMDSDNNFMIVYNNFITRFSSQGYITSTGDNIEKAIEEISNQSISGRSKLSSLIPDALQKIEELGQETELIIMSSGNDTNDKVDSEGFAEAIIQFSNEMQTDFNLSILDYAMHKSYIFGVASEFRGNEYLYSLLTTHFDATFYNTYRGDDLNTSTEILFKSEQTTIEQFNINIDIDDGFTYSEYISNTQDGINLTEPIVFVGKYLGNSDLDLAFKAFHDNTLYSDAITMTEAESIEIGRLTKTIWQANYIDENEEDTDLNSITDIIERSTEERLLSTRTIFLCLEPDSTEISNQNFDEDDIVLVSTDEQVLKHNIEVKVYPNPFTFSLNIEFEKEEGSKLEDYKVEIWNFQGQLIERLTDLEFTEEKIKTEWIPSNKLPLGSYFVKVITGNRILTEKVIYL